MRRMMPRLDARFLLLASLLGFAAACQPEIGAECETSVDCSQNGDRLCDRTQPGGYCTAFNCAAGDCPDDSVCVAFGASLAYYAGCDGDGTLSRVSRTFCMAPCDSAADCRSGYACQDLASSGDVSSVVSVDPGRSSKVCVVAQSLAVPDETDGRSKEVCQQNDGAGGGG